MAAGKRNDELIDDVEVFYADPSPAGIESFIVTHDRHWRRMAHSLVLRHKLEDETYVDEAYQSVVEEVWRLLDDPPRDLIVSQFGKLVLYRANSRFIKAMRKIPMLSGVSDLIARRAAFERTRRAMLFELGYEPEQADVIEAHNAAARRSITEEDLTTIGDVVWVDEIASDREQSGGDVYDMLSSVRPADVDLIDIGDVLAQTIAERDDVEREIIEAHVAYSLDNGVPATRKAIAAQCGCSTSTVAVALERFHDDLVSALDSA